MTFEQGPWNEIRDGVFVARCQPESVNIGLVVGTEGCVLIDTGASPAQGRAIRESIAQVTDRDLVAVVVTHAHYDHAFGLAAFGDVETIGHESLPDDLSSPTTREHAARLGIDPGDLAAPSRTISLVAAKDLGGKRVEICYFGEAHTPGDLVVVVPEAHVLFTGDLLEEPGPPSVEEESTLAGWSSALDSILGLTHPDTIAVPGHGEPVDRIFAYQQRAGLAAVWGQCQWLVDKGIKQEQALDQPELEWPWDEAAARHLIAHAYAELARSGYVPRPQLPIVDARGGA